MQRTYSGQTETTFPFLFLLNSRYKTMLKCVQMTELFDHDPLFHALEFVVLPHQQLIVLNTNNSPFILNNNGKNLFIPISFRVALDVSSKLYKAV